MTEGAPIPSARILLGGHTTRPAHLEAVRYPFWARTLRTLAHAVAWVGSTWLTLVFTFDPFVASFPFVLGGAFTWRSWKGRFRVAAFRGECPRCRRELELREGSKIDLPHSMTCYNCHHEPELAA